MTTAPPAATTASGCSAARHRVRHTQRRRSRELRTSKSNRALCGFACDLRIVFKVQLHRLRARSLSRDARRQHTTRCTSRTPSQPGHDPRAPQAGRHTHSHLRTQVAPSYADVADARRARAPPAAAAEGSDRMDRRPPLNAGCLRPQPITCPAPVPGPILLTCTWRKPTMRHSETSRKRRSTPIPCSAHYTGSRCCGQNTERARSAPHTHHTHARTHAHTHTHTHTSTYTQAHTRARAGTRVQQEE